jgi:endonuclease III
VDDLVYIILSNKTAPAMARRVYAELKGRFSSWDEVLNAKPSILVGLLRPAGLANVKSRQIRGALEKLSRDFGRCTMKPLRSLSEPEVASYLTSLPGVSEKVAKCVMMYTMGFLVLPVDVHVHRISVRLGWTQWKRADQSHEDLEALVPAKRRYAFHVDCIEHGRTICTPSRPACERCPIAKWCEYFKTKHDD